MSRAQTQGTAGGRVIRAGVSVHNSRSVRVLHVVACPERGADVGEPCRTAAGTSARNYHRSRRVLAVRAERAAR